MFTRLTNDSYGSLAALPLKTFPLIAAVLEGRQSGAVFSDAAETIFIVSKSGFSFLWSPDSALDVEAFTTFLVGSHAVPQYLHIYDPPPTLVAYLRQKPEQFGMKLRTRIQLQYRKEQISPAEFRPLSTAEFQEITSENLRDLDALDLDIGDRFWDSESHFLKDGYGLYLQAETVAPVAVCYAAGIGNGLAEVDIHTSPDHQKNGFAKYAAALFIQQGLRRGIRTNWDCFEDNVGSLKTALALQFTAVKNYPLLSIYLKEKENEISAT